jgi:hypothetical protein
MVRDAIPSTAHLTILGIKSWRISTTSREKSPAAI